MLEVTHKDQMLGETCEGLAVRLVTLTNVTMNWMKLLCHKKYEASKPSCVAAVAKLLDKVVIVFA